MAKLESNKRTQCYLDLNKFNISIQNIGEKSYYIKKLTPFKNQTSSYYFLVI